MTESSQSTSSRRLFPVAGFVSTTQIWSWLDQAVVSATSFLVLILVARWASVEQVGYYAIGGSILALAVTFQDSLVTRPYSIQLFKLPGLPAAHAFGSLALSILLSVSTAVILGLGALLLPVLGAPRDSATLILVLAAAAPLVLGREFARRYCFANLLMRQALVLDTATSSILIAALSYLAWTGQLSAYTALGAAGLACGTSIVAWFAMKRKYFAYRAAAIGKTFRQSWELGRWLLSSQLALQLQSYIAHWITLLIAGAAATGIYSACLSIVALANPFLFGFFNVLTPKFVRTLRNSGHPGLRREAAFDALILGAVMGAFTIFILLFGEVFMNHLYPGGEYAGHTHVLSILALSATVAAIGAPAAIALTTTEHGRAAAGVAVGTCFLGSILVWLLMSNWGLVGATYGILLTEIIGSLGRWALFLLIGRGAGLFPSARVPVQTFESTTPTTL
jgi:O-antigen/teichoic acid export membrane protein